MGLLTANRTQVSSTRVSLRAGGPADGSPAGTAARELSAETWADYFDSITPSVEGMLVTVEVVNEHPDGHAELERRPLRAINYDDRGNVLEVDVGGRNRVFLRHFIASPQTISVAGFGDPGPNAILVTDASGVQTLIRLAEHARLLAA